MVASKLAAQETNHQTTLGAVVAEAAANIQSHETVTRPLLEALAGISGLEGSGFAIPTRCDSCWIPPPCR